MSEIWPLRQRIFISENHESLYEAIAYLSGRITLGYEEWKTSPILFYPLNVRKSTLGSFSNVPKNFYVGGGYAWTGEKRLEIKLHFVNWMSAVGFDLDFENGKLSATLRNNYSDTLEKIEGAIR